MFRNLTIKTKLAGTLAFLILIIISMSVLFMIQMQKMQQTMTTLQNDTIPSLSIAKQIPTQLLSIRRYELASALAALVGNRDKAISDLDNFDKALNETDKVIQSYANIPLTDTKEKEAYANIGSDREKYLSLHKVIVEKITSSNRDGIWELISDSRKVIGEIIKNAEILSQINLDSSKYFIEAQRDDIHVYTQIITALFIIVLVISVFLGFWLFKQIQKPIDLLTSQVKKVAAGDLSSSLDLSKINNDEFGVLGNGLVEMQASLKNLVLELNDVIKQVSISSNEISVGASQSANNMSVQRNELNQLATAMNEMQATVQEVSRNTGEAATASTNASDQTKEGSAQVQGTIVSIETVAGSIERTAEVIRELSDNSRNIGVVLDVIKNIADQTNLLALNAAIEAARAGEQGRGFAVVADEVRTLAKRTQDSISEISSIISGLQVRSTQATETMDESKALMSDVVQSARLTGDSIDAIQQSVINISQMNTQVATATEEQAAVSEELNRNILNISNASEEVAHGATHMANLCGNLQALSGRLQKISQQFQI